MRRRVSAYEPPDGGLMEGKTVVLTGANGGIGTETARGLALRGAAVVMACRDEDAGEAAVQDVQGDAPHARLEVRHLDLADPRSIQRFAKQCMKNHSYVDVLINNAGVIPTRRKETAEGLELGFAVNHLGHFRLTHALLPSLEKAPEPRVVTVSSIMHHFARPRWDDLQVTRRFEPNTQYANTKLYNLWFAQELATRLRDQKSTVSSNAVHPGSGGTGLTRHYPAAIRHTWPLLLRKGPVQLAKTSVRAASDPGLADVSGAYFHMGRHAHRSRLARDEDAQRRLWAMTEALA